ncbi:MAG: glycoside hydrolase family 15 protein [Geitlerinemataceae cyanobacterium]
MNSVFGNAAPDVRDSLLDTYYEKIKGVILAKQHPVSGLLPASTAINEHGDYTDAWVRDNVYSILAAWGLALAYRKTDDRQGRGYELEHSTVKLMRGLLTAMMRQSHKVERFKYTQAPLDALHAKYDTPTGDKVVEDDRWGHLQIDATSVFVLMLAQMTASGLSIVYGLDEVNFVQNLVYYIGRAYRTPDYGIWERGNKINHGKPELNASSIGMAKAALDAIDGLNLFGARGGQASTIYVLPDEVARMRVTLQTLLPRESASKEVDASVLSAIGFPAFAVEDAALIDRTYEKIVAKLEGRYGCKRFLRDGHQTAIEDSERLHYEPEELLRFVDIECEWPLFFTYQYLFHLFRGEREKATEYRQKLEAVTVDRDGWALLPEVYYVPADRIEAERQNPHSQDRQPNDNLPLVWAQSLFWLGKLMDDGAIVPGDLDPLGNHLKSNDRQRPRVQVALLTEDLDLQADLATYGIATQTPEEIAPIQVRPARDLTQVYERIGRNDRLGLTGRPGRRLRSLSTSQIYWLRGETVVFLPSFLNQREFYLTLDYHFLVEQIRSELAYVYRHWHSLGRPTMTLMLTRQLLDTGRDAMLDLIHQLESGECGGIPVQLGTLAQFVQTSGSERIDFIHGHDFETATTCDSGVPTNALPFLPEASQPLTPGQEFDIESERNVGALVARLRETRNIYEQTEILHTIATLESLHFNTGIGHGATVADLLEELYAKASRVRSGETNEAYWSLVRYTAGLLGRYNIGLSDAVTDILVRQKQILIGKAFSEDSLIVEPLPLEEIVDKIAHFCREDIRDRVLTQEILIYLSGIVKAEPKLFDGFLTLRVGYLILLLTSELARERGLTQDEAYNQLMFLSPFEIKTRLRNAIAGYGGLGSTLEQQETLHPRKSDRAVDWHVLPQPSDDNARDTDWHRQRQHDGAAGRVPVNFYPGVWKLLQNCKGLVIGDKLESRNRLDSDPIVSEMTPGEKNFALRVERLLNKIHAPQYRQLTIEALTELVAIFGRNPYLVLDDYIVLDVLIGHAVRLSWLDARPERHDRYDEDKSLAWAQFYQMSPFRCATYFVRAFQFLTQLEGEIAA